MEGIIIKNKKEEYIKSLENLLIFMCQTYKEIDELVLEDFVEDRSDFLMRFPKIQSVNFNATIAYISQLPFENPNLKLEDIYKNLKKRKKNFIVLKPKINSCNALILCKTYKSPLMQKELLELELIEKGIKNGKIIVDFMLKNGFEASNRFFELNFEDKELNIDSLTRIDNEKSKEKINKITLEYYSKNKKYIDNSVEKKKIKRLIKK